MPDRLSDSDYTKLTKMLEALKDVKIDGDVPAQFVAERIEKHNQWGRGMYMSAKQMAWLQRIYDEYIGDEAPEEREGSHDEMNDEIPF